MTARYAGERWTWRVEPRAPDYRPYVDVVPERYCAPADCEHPVSARVTSVFRGCVAMCHDCGASLFRGRWMLL